MKNSIRILSIVLTVAAMSFTSCKDDGCGDGPHPGGADCNTELIFMDHAFCSGDWFKTTSGEYLEVYGYPDASKLKKGDRVKFGYTNYDNSELIECMAVSPFEMWLGENNLTFKTVKANRKCFKDDKEEPTKCDTELTFMDPGMCSGAWFKTNSGEYLEVYDYPIDGLKKGDKVKFGYRECIQRKYGCLAIGDFEMWLRENNYKTKTVCVLPECLKPRCGNGNCDTKVTYYRKDFCSGDLIKTEDGKLLRAFGLNLTDREYKEGDQFRISYKSKVLQNDCTYVRQPDEIGEPVDITCQTGASSKE